MGFSRGYGPEPKGVTNKLNAGLSNQTHVHFLLFAGGENWIWVIVMKTA